MNRKPAVMTWRGWYLKCMSLNAENGDVLLKRWREWFKEMAWEQLSPLQRMAFDGSLHLIEPLVAKAKEEGRSNPFLGERNILVYAVMSRNIDTVSFFLRNGFGDPAELRKGESWTGFTAMHVALFTQYREMCSLLWNTWKANVNVKDYFFGSVLDYARLLGLVVNAEVYFRGHRKHYGYNYGYNNLEHMVQCALRAPHSFDSPEEIRETFEQQHVQLGDKVYIPYWNKKTREMEHMPLLEWADLTHTCYQDFVSAQDSWLDELMFNGCYVRDPTPELRIKYAAPLRNLPRFETPENVFMSYINTRIGFACYALRDLAKDEFVMKYGGYLHTDRYKWKERERTTPFRLNFMRQIHDLGERGKDLIRKPVLPRYTRDPCYNVPIPGTVFWLNSTEAGNMGRIINHSSLRPNVKLVIIWNAGVPQALVIATKDIRKGDQILLDYQSTFWHDYEERRSNKMRAAADEPRKLSLWNYNEEETLMTRETRTFFSESQAVEMANFEGFPARIEIDNQ